MKSTIRQIRAGSGMQSCLVGVLLALALSQAAFAADTEKLGRECASGNSKSCTKLGAIATNPKEKLSDRLAAIQHTSDTAILQSLSHEGGEERIKTAASDRLDELARQEAERAKQQQAQIQARADERKEALAKVNSYQVSIEMGLPVDIFSVFRDCGHDVKVTSTEYSLGLSPVRQTPLRILGNKLTGLMGMVTVGDATGPIASLTFNQNARLANLEFVGTLTPEERQEAQAFREGGAQATRVMQFLRKLLADGKLPGFRPGEEVRAWFEQGRASFADFRELAKALPITVTVTNAAERSISYRYTVTKGSPTVAEWSLVEAKRVGPQGDSSDLLAVVSEPSAPMLDSPSAEVFKVGNGVSAPLLLFKTDPRYTDEARAACISGTVQLEFVVGTDGVPYDVRVVKGLGKGLDESAVQTLKTWRFKPGRKDGRPVNIRSSVEVSFQIGACSTGRKL